MPGIRRGGVPEPMRVPFISFIGYKKAKDELNSRMIVYYGYEALCTMGRWSPFVNKTKISKIDCLSETSSFPRFDQEKDTPRLNDELISKVMAKLKNDFADDRIQIQKENITINIHQILLCTDHTTSDTDQTVIRHPGARPRTKRFGRV